MDMQIPFTGLQHETIFTLHALTVSTGRSIPTPLQGLLYIVNSNFSRSPGLIYNKFNIFYGKQKRYSLGFLLPQTTVLSCHLHLLMFFTHK